jgi:NitT/TauT family transport system substrate-binding protein
MKDSTRRVDILRAGAAGAGLIAFTGWPALGAAQGLPKFSYGDLVSGVTGIISANIGAKRFDVKHGVDMANALPYTAVSAYYNDFAAGTFDIAMGSWDFFIDMYQKGVPIKMVCTVTTADMINVIAAPAIKSMSDLVGKSMSAVIGSGSFTMTRAVMLDALKIDLNKDVQMQNAPSPAGCISLLQAGSATSALSWEPAISNAIAEQPGLRPIFNLGHTYRQVAHNGVLPYFSVAVRADALKKNPGLAARIAGVFGDTINYINHNTGEAFANSTAKTGLAPAVMQTAFDAKRLTFASFPMGAPSGQQVVTDAYAYLRSRGVFDKPLAADFFA